ncbi:hypothetical protein GA0111570_101383 [Raineyella antarctica]|uniref:Uncharacterized protein n=1 Tax=Raineyella antarctica TaxID=1577474 RepID=A0A1G6GDN1_9ACTN|nr:hypothetical protein [Raineyella antarctica]SDB80108.1 hypothetical protein GA0111570_101383 [Raineyella antarctica]
MAFTWATTPVLDEATAADLGLATGFPDQSAAEAWFSEHWTELDDAGIEAVTLLEAGTVVYGPMSLSA